MALQVTSLRKSFGSLAVTRDVSLDLQDGECHALIGPNGAGKSTLINLITGALAPETGRIELAGKDITALDLPRRARAGLGRTFQITTLLPQFSVLENAALAAQARDGSSFRLLRRAAKETALNSRAQEVLEQVHLSHRAQTPVADLSHGEQRLLELALALLGDPKALLLDEPMAGMGKGESMELTETLQRLKAKTPILLVEHDMDAVFELADRISVLTAGEIIATGTPDEIRANDDARAAYLGTDT